MSSQELDFETLYRRYAPDTQASRVTRRNLLVLSVRPRVLRASVLFFESRRRLRCSDEYARLLRRCEAEPR